MAFELITHLDDGGETRIADPSPDDAQRAAQRIRDDEAYLVDLRDIGTNDLLQFVGTDTASVGAARFGADDRQAPLFSVSESLADADVKAVSAAFLAGARIDECGVAFNDVAWFNRADNVQASPVHHEALPVEEEQIDPLEMMREAMRPRSLFCKDGLLAALAAGASFEQLAPVPPLVYLAQNDGDPAAIECLLGLGERLDAREAGETALWHAVQRGHYSFADELVANGAERSEARSSARYERWEQRAARRSILDHVEDGNTAAVKRYLHGRQARQVSQDLLLRAIECEQLAVLQLLLLHKGRITLDKVHQESIWGRALQKADTRYLQLLIDHGGYEGVAAAPQYGGREFVHATPEALAYLLASGHTAGMSRGFATLIDSHRPSAGRLLAVFPDAYFRGLSGQRQARALLHFLRVAPERVDMVLDQNDFAQLVGALVRDADDEAVLQALPRAFGIAVAGPAPPPGRHANISDYLKGVRAELCGMALAIWKD